MAVSPQKASLGPTILLKCLCFEQFRVKFGYAIVPMPLLNGFCYMGCPADLRGLPVSRAGGRAQDHDPAHGYGSSSSSFLSLLLRGSGGFSTQWIDFKEL